MLSNDGLLVGSYVRGNEVVWQVVLLVVMEKDKVDGRKWGERRGKAMDKSTGELGLPPCVCGWSLLGYFWVDEVLRYVCTYVCM